MANNSSRRRRAPRPLAFLLILLTPPSDSLNGGLARRRTRGSAARAVADVEPAEAAPQTVEEGWKEEAQARVIELRASIAKQNIELESLERRLLCCGDRDTIGGLVAAPSMGDWAAARALQGFFSALEGSSGVLRRRFARADVRQDPMAFAMNTTSSSARILAELIVLPKDQRDARVMTLAKYAPMLVVHAPGILARLDRLEAHVPGIVTKILDGGHLGVIEPELDKILDRFDDIEPHVPWILDNIDALAPNIVSLMRHIDELLLYADEEYEWADDFLPYLPYFVSRLDDLGPHLPLLRPHLRRLRPHFGRLVPCVDRVLLEPKAFGVSANADVVLFWFGWALRIPFFVPAFVRLPFGPRVISFMARRLPRRWVRNYCAGVECLVDERNYAADWNKAYDPRLNTDPGWWRVGRRRV
mmetsp:Transcript_7502/g.22221  ORF Transcript_7502/g.22221 Transcript_7502/m.22221 type:complete len:416 (-) Transcript_7502:36-1283(-)